MRVDRPGRGDQPLAGDDRGAGAHDHIDVVHHVGVAGPPDPADPTVADADRDLADLSGGVDHDDVGDHHVARLAHRGSLEQQAVASGLAEPGKELVASLLGVVLDLDDQPRVAETDAIADRGAVNGGIVVGQDLVGMQVVVRHLAIGVAVLELAVRMPLVGHECAPR